MTDIQKEIKEAYAYFETPHIKGRTAHRHYFALKQGLLHQQELIEHWKREAFKAHPTQDAYDAVCQALQKHKDEIEQKDTEIELRNGHIRVFKGKIDSQKVELERYQKYEDELIAKTQQQADEIRKMGGALKRSGPNKQVLHQQELIEQKKAEVKELLRINSVKSTELFEKDTEIERIEEKWKKLLRVRMDADNTKIWKLQEGNKRLRDALEWYAGDQSWGTFEEAGLFIGDGGERARNTLSSIGGKK